MPVRRARPEDASAVADLLGELGYPTDSGGAGRRLRRLADDGGSDVFVATVAGEVVALAALHVALALEHDAPTCLLVAMVVSEGHRRRGLGSLLLRAVEEEARRRGCGRVVLGSAERRRDAHAFYERLGYERTGRRYVKRI